MATSTPQNTPRRFALHGPMFSGKSSLAKALFTYYNFEVLDYTDWGKKLVSGCLTTLLGRTVTHGEVRRRKNEWRPFIIEALRMYGFDQGNGVAEMVTEREQLLLGCLDDAVFDNVRYLSQYEALKPYGFTLVRLHISQEEQERRALRNGMPLDVLLTLRAESSEQPLPPVDGEIHLFADGQLPEQLAAMLVGHAVTTS